jgi:hypothetical protein
MDDRIPTELIARIRRVVPKGKIRVEPLAPIKGEQLEPMTWDQVRSAAPHEEPRKKKAA